MKKTFRKIGNSIGIIFNKEEQRINGIEVGKIANLDDMIIEKQKEKKK